MAPRSGDHFPAGRSSLALLLLAVLPVVVSPMTALGRGTGFDAAPPQPTLEPGADRLAQPVLGESPTQAEIGGSLYYYHCMPCHGDRGQGLTEEWRSVWEEDHRNCWARGCHTGKSELTAFYIPREVPPVSGTAGALGRFQTTEELFAFLRETQPPQRPGALADGEYWALTAFLLRENGRLSPGGEVGPGALDQATSGADALLATLVPLAALLAVRWWGKRP